MTKRILCWFRRDLRLDDNTALLAAYAAAEEVVPVFIFDDAILSRPDTGAVRVAFLLESLRNLDENLRARGSQLLLRRGRPEQVLAQLVTETAASAVYFNRDVEPFALVRDARVQAHLEGRCAVEAFDDSGLTAPDAIRTKAGTPYTVFTPYKQAVLAQPVPHPRPAPAMLRTPANVPSDPWPSLKDLGFATSVSPPPGGETPAQARLQDFIQNGLARYATERDVLSADGTSRLSPYLRFGCLSPRRAYWAAREAVPEGAPGAETWIAELIWRDFYRQILFHFPYVETGAFRRAYDDLAWENNASWFDLWCQGKTGFPIVDAAMRQLLTTGWMHNRARMIVASFLAKHLLIDWRQGEAWFWDTLIDADPASNAVNWQWVAGTGIEASPFFRIFNPLRQSDKFDPKGDYIRRWVPELARLPDDAIAAPWQADKDVLERAGIRLGRDYPEPIVSLDEGRDRAMTAYRKTKGS